jgi:hypothetical protein
MLMERFLKFSFTLSFVLTSEVSEKRIFVLSSVISNCLFLFAPLHLCIAQSVRYHLFHQDQFFVLDVERNITKT